jgi:DNA replication and repair protein RecF
MMVNGTKVASSSGFYGNLKCVEFTPDDLNLVSGSPGDRRKFFDRLVSQISESYFENLLAYHRALKQRNSLILRGENSQSVFIPWNELLVDKGLFVAEQRKEFSSKFRAFFASNYSYFTGYEENKSAVAGIESAEIKYVSKFLDEEGDIRSKEDLMSEYSNRLSQDISRRTSTFGVHRDDYEIFLDTGGGNRQAKKAASQGQKRSISLALKFAAVSLIEKITGDRPVVLLDDVESELDKFRKQALFGKIAELGGQVMITATELSDENRRNLISPDVFKIEEGLVEKSL